MRLLTTLVAALPIGLAAVPAARADEAPPAPPAGVRRVVFLGDSVTYSGQFVEYLEAYLRLRNPGLRVEFLNLGLPSETVSGLSEPGHAGGQFPRPDLHERLGRVLERTRPDLVVACYGMNDGIYYPFAEERFARFRAGIQDLRARALEAGAKVLHLTPPVFDPEPIRGNTLPAGLDEYRKPFVGYDDVLGRYSEWLVGQKGKGWDVVDVHGPMERFLLAQRENDPKFRLAGDGVHLDELGHWVIARQILSHWGDRTGATAVGSRPGPVFESLPHGPAVLDLVRRKQRSLKDAWLTATGHRRPGMAQGLPLDEARRRAAATDTEIVRLLNPAP